MKVLNAGLGNFLIVDRVLAVFNPDSSPMKRAREDAKTAGTLMDATQGRKTRSIILLDTGHLVLSGIQTETLANRLQAAEESGTAK